MQSADVGLPNITVPQRTGYTFDGYFSEPSGGGTQYYENSGTGATGITIPGSITLYAKWTVNSFEIRYANMEGAACPVSLPQSHTYGIRTAIPTPVKEGYTFFGWQVNGNAVSQQGLTLGAYDFLDTVTLTAVWNKAALVSVVDNATQTVIMSSEDLQRLFYRQVTDPDKGITANDLNSEEVRLTMTASDADEQAEGAAEVIALSQGEVLKLYDFSVSKTVKAYDGSVVTSALNELPATVQIDITLSDAVSCAAGYRVYRYHNGEAQSIPSGTAGDTPETAESFYVSDDGAALTIYTRRLSTYAVVANTKTVMEPGPAGMDVQAKILQSGVGAVYRVDIAWGAMRFYYSADAIWNPRLHEYDSELKFKWAENLSYENGNNQVKVYNHSNADVVVSMIVTNQSLPGVDMQLFMQNEPDGMPAENLTLSRVPQEDSPAPFVSGYLRLNGTPDNWRELIENKENDGFTKVASIAVTISELNSPLTPKS